MHDFLTNPYIADKMKPDQRKGDTTVKELSLHTFTLSTALTGYMPVPRELLEMELPSTAILLYAVLLDRAALSQKNRYSDGNGVVYVIYPIDKLAETLSISDTAVKRNLKVLEQKGLIWKVRETKNGPNHIFLNIPEGSKKNLSAETFCPVVRTKMTTHTGQEVTTNNKKKRHEKENYYQHGEDESL